MIKYDAIKKYAELHPDKIALLDGNKTLTWGEFGHLTLSAIHAISEIPDFAYDKPILFISENSVDVVLLGAAFSSMGVPFQGIDYHLNTSALRALIKKLDVKYIFVSKNLENKFLELNDLCQLYQIEYFIKKLNMLHDELPEIYHQVSAQKFRSYSFTSGTTDIPKIAYRTISFDKRRFEYLNKRYQFNNNDVHLVSLPMHHVASTGWLRLFLGLGCTSVIRNFINAYELCEILHVNKISTTIMSPYMVKQVMEVLNKTLGKKYFPNLRFIITGGKNFPINLKKEAIEKLGPIFCEYYGTTETGINTLLDSDQAMKYPGSVGQIFEGNHIVILDKNNYPVKDGKIGRIAIHSYMNMDYYLNSDAKFICFNENKYLLTADYGYFNADGYLFVVQRVNTVKNEIFDFYALENEILKLNYISDVFVTDTVEEKKAIINVVPKKYYPYAQLRNDIEKITVKFGIKKSIIDVMPELNYTSTGKLKLVPTAAV